MTRIIVGLAVLVAPSLALAFGSLSLQRTSESGALGLALWEGSEVEARAPYALTGVGLEWRALGKSLAGGVSLRLASSGELNGFSLNTEIGTTISAWRVTQALGLYQLPLSELADFGLVPTVGFGAGFLEGEDLPDGTYLAVPVRLQLYVRFLSLLVTASVSKELRGGPELEYAEGAWPFIWDVGAGFAW